MMKAGSIFALLVLLPTFASTAAPNFGTEVQRSPAGVEGGSDGGGGDVIQPWADSAWFVGATRTVSACYEKSNDFGLSNHEVETAIQAAYKVWADYLAAKTGEINHTTTIDVPTKIRILPNCSGAEDLTFYFGVKNAEVKAAQADYFHPLAFSHRRAHKTFTWDPGFIWVGDSALAKKLLGFDWTTSDLLTGMLVHEIGHVLGNGHVAGTIMRASILNFMTWAAKHRAWRRHVMMTSVDWNDDLMEMGFNFNFPGSVSYQSGDSWDQKWFHEIMGRDPVGKPTSRMWRTDGDFHFVLSDEAGSQDFPLEKLGFLGGTSVSRQKTVFKIYQPPAYPGANNIYFVNDDEGPDVIIEDAYITVSGGRKARVTFQRGGGMTAAWKIQYQPISGGGPWSVFAKLPGGIPLESPKELFEVSNYENLHPGGH